MNSRYEEKQHFLFNFSCLDTVVFAGNVYLVFFFFSTRVSCQGIKARLVHFKKILSSGCVIMDLLT